MTSDLLRLQSALLDWAAMEEEFDNGRLIGRYRSGQIRLGRRWSHNKSRPTAPTWLILLYAYWPRWLRKKISVPRLEHSVFAPWAEKFIERRSR